MKKTNLTKRILVTTLVAAIALQTAGCTSANSNTKNDETPGEAVVETDVDYSALSEEELQALYEKEEAYGRNIVIPYDGGACTSAIPIADWQGFFENNGITVDFVSSADARDALIAGKVDVAIGMLTDYMTPIQNGLEIQFTTALHTGCTSAAVSADSEYKGFEKGQKIGISGPIGGYIHNIVLRMVAHDGFKSDDFEWIALDSGTILAALQKGEADVIVAYDQLIYQWEDDGEVRVIRSQTYDDDFKDEACCAVGFTKEFIDKNPVTVYKITKSLKEAALWLDESEENKQEAVAYLLEKGWTSGTEYYNMKVLNGMHFSVTFQTLQKSLDDIVSEFVDLGILDAKLDQEKFKENLLVDYNIDSLLK